MRQGFTPGGGTFEMRGDIGGFGAGSKFSWQIFGGYNADFEVNGMKLVGLIGYRALGMDFSTWVNGHDNGLNASHSRPRHRRRHEIPTRFLV